MYRPSNSGSASADRIRDRIAEEAQLLSEEKWIIDSLTKVKNQRNCLQVERLQMESLQTIYKQKLNETCPENYEQYSAVFSENKTNQGNTSTSTGTTRNNGFEETLNGFGLGNQNIDLDACNDEELDLQVSKSVFGQEFKSILEEDEEEEDDDMVFIDMNMFMNAKNSCGK